MPADSSTFPRRFAATQRFTLGAPRTISVSKDGDRIVFARSGAGDDPVNKLWAIDLPDLTPRLLVDPAKLLASGAEMTDAERARRERAREAGGGIVTYQRDTSLDTVVFALSGRLFRCDVASGETVEIPCDGAAFDPRLDPTGQRIAYTSGTALRVSDKAGDRVIAAEDDPAISWGSAEFIAAEEMGRSRGYWWAPEGDRILAARVDVSVVDTWHIAAPVDPASAPRAIRYPGAGTTNATVDLAVVGLDGSRVNIDWRGDEFEYLADARWSKQRGITVVAQTRDQRTLAILAVDAESGAVTELQRIVDTHWVELVHGAPAWSGERLVTVVDEGEARQLAVDGIAITGSDLQVRSVLRVDETTATVVATTDATEAHVYVVQLDSGEVVPLTDAPGMHGAALGGETAVVSSATPEHFGSRVSIVKDGEEIGEIDSFAETPDLTPNVTFHRVGSRELNTALVLPEHDDSRPLPVLLDPYGGPHALRVLKSRNAFLTSQWFANQGFAVIVTDGRGTPARGPAFEREVYGDLATGVLEDQVDALAAIAESHPDLLDLGRVAIRGWSFGGYLAALAVIRRPDVFHAAVAGAPVTDWRLYDTHYTERYLGHPAEVPEHYDTTDLCQEAAALTRPLMLIHGLADDNVVAAHTLSLSRALLEAGRPHEVLPLSGVTHMTPQESVAENLLRLQLDFIERSLPG